MKDVAFQELLSSIRQAGRVRRGKLKPSRVTTFYPADVKSVREKLKASQTEFALMIGVSVATLRNWEQDGERLMGPLWPSCASQHVTHALWPRRCIASHAKALPRSGAYVLFESLQAKE